MTTNNPAAVLVGCLHDHEPALLTEFEQQLEAHGLSGQVEVINAGCRGMCSLGPTVLIQPEQIFYTNVHTEDVPDLVEKTLVNGETVERLTYKPIDSHETVRFYGDTPFYRRQVRNVMGRCGMIDPQSIDHYIAHEGYKALGDVVTSFSPEEVIEEVKKSGLRGRSGGGFATGRKWEHTRHALGSPKYVIANGDEGNPGAFMNRSLMEGDPHSIIEGMIIGGYAIGSSQGYIYVRDEYPLAVHNLSLAISQALEAGLLGSDILGSGFDFRIDIVRGAGAFVCGESSALMQSVEGKVGEPRPKHYHATDRGLWNLPTALNNVETWADIPLIINRGADWFASIGTEGSTGTKAFCLAGAIRNRGLIEVPLGMTLREIIFDIGGGVRGNHEFKAVLTGGPSGGCIPASLLDMSVDYDSLAEVGSMMGSGGMIVVDDHTCMVDLARYFLDFLREESCGQCTPCREGIRCMLGILTRITEGKGEMSDLDKLEELAVTVQTASLCGLGKSAPNPVLSTLRYYRDEYIAHIDDRKCPAGVCKALITYTIDAEACTGCEVCRPRCPQNAIGGEREEPHIIEPELCIKCGICHDVCKFDAVIVT